MMDALIGAAGALLAAVIAADIFRSLLVPRANTRLLRVLPFLGQALFAGWQPMVGRIRGNQLRQNVRASLAPLILVLTLAVWVTLLILGFGMLFWADRGSFSPGFTTFGDAVFAAGSVFSTLGTPGPVASILSRIAVLTCSVTGLAIVTVVATFLISIQTGFGRRETLVLRLESHVTLPPAGINILEIYAADAIADRLETFFGAWELWAAEVAITHRAFPILLFFRSNDSRCEWLAAFGAVMDAAALLDSVVVQPDPHARAGAHFLLLTGTRMLGDMAQQVAAAGADPELADAGRFHAHRERLAAAGYQVLEDEGAALRRYTERRRSYGPSLIMLARRLYIDIDERGADDADSRPGR